MKNAGREAERKQRQRDGLRERRGNGENERKRGGTGEEERGERDSIGA